MNAAGIPLMRIEGEYYNLGNVNTIKSGKKPNETVISLNKGYHFGDINLPQRVRVNKPIEEVVQEVGRFVYDA